MKPESWFVRELKLISPRYDVRWNGERWQIWYSPKVGKPYVHSTVAKFEDINERQVDVGFHPLDRRVLHSVRLSQFYGENPEVALMDVDLSNEAMQRRSDENEDLALKDLAKSLKRRYGNGTVPDAVQPNHVTVDCGARA